MGPSEVVTQAARDSVRQIDQIHQDIVLKAQCWRGIKFSVAETLPELEAHPNSGSVADDLQKQRDWRNRKWEKIKAAKEREDAEKQEHRQWQHSDVHGQKRKHDDLSGPG